MYLLLNVINVYYFSLGDALRSNYSPELASYQSPRLQLQHGSPKDHAPPTQSPLIYKPAEGAPNYTSSLRSSLEKPSSGTPLSGVDYGSGRLSASSTLRKSLLEGDANTKTNGDLTSPVGRSSSGDYSSYRKSLLAEYRNSAGVESAVGSSRLLQENNYKSNQSSVTKQGHSQTPAATETSNFTSALLKGSTSTSRQPGNVRAEQAPASVVRGTDSNVQSLSGSQQQLSVFNYEGGDRSGSRSHLHMLMNHNLMNARQPDENNNKKKTSNSKKTRRKITVNLQGTRYEVGE